MLGSKFIIVTDHKPLKSLFTNEIKSAKVQNWAVTISEFDCEVVYRKGSDNFLADMVTSY